MKVYEYFNYPQELQLPVIKVVNSINFKDLTREEKTDLSIQGHFRIGQDILIRDINHKFRKALGQVADPKINVKARATVGNHIGQIKSVYDLY